ncbi:MAG: response regulator [Muribaculaceae bacterium]|nr:response regulator [Muribaculaceae bacterium]MDE6321910.1 response regulator [Muribaculaceae bacterium]
MPNAPTILVIDADPIARQIISDTIRHEGYNVEEWDSMLSYEDLDELECSMVIVDIELEKSIRSTLVSDMRHHSVTMYMPIIVCTGLSSDSDVITVLNEGADDYITKPFSPATLTARVKSIMRRHYKYHAIG